MKNIFFFLITIVLFSACTEVIEVELKESDIQIVIEGILKDDSTQMVKISKSGNFTQNTGFEKVSNAIVRIEDESGNIWDLNETESGLYEAINNVISGKTYKLSVESEGEQYEAQSFLFAPVALDTISVESFGPGGGGPNGRLTLFVGLNDPGVAENFYRVRLTINDTIQSGYNVFDDLTSNGAYLERPIRDSNIESGDVVKVDLLTIDKATYDYFNSLADIEGQGLNASVPYNPITNLNNNALGYFSAQSVSSKVVIVP